jgi:hypothetical protein
MTARRKIRFWLAGQVLIRSDIGLSIGTRTKGQRQCDQRSSNDSEDSIAERKKTCHNLVFLAGFMPDAKIKTEIRKAENDRSKAYIEK